MRSPASKADVKVSVLLLKGFEKREQRSQIYDQEIGAELCNPYMLQ